MDCKAMFDSLLFMVYCISIVLLIVYGVALLEYLFFYLLVLLGCVIDFCDIVYFVFSDADRRLSRDHPSDSVSLYTIFQTVGVLGVVRKRIKNCEGENYRRHF